MIPAKAESHLAPTATVHTPRWQARTRALLALILIVSGTATILAMRRTSTTFDEIIFMAGGARGYATGDWSIQLEHPPLAQYLYGLLPYLTHPAYPDEATFEVGRYTYSRHFFFGVGNDPETLAFLGRLPAVMCQLLLVLLVFGFTRRRFGDAAGLLAAAIVAFLPDVLAHGGVAYNDVPVALLMFASVWLCDVAVRRPGFRPGLAFGLAAGLALGTKNSAITIAPIALLLLSAEATVRRRDRDWWRRIPVAACAALIGTYVALVLIYRGDVALSEYRYSLGFVFGQVTAIGAPAYILGRVSPAGWWYYFPLAFLFKTSAALHVLLALSMIYFGSRLRAPDLLGRLLRSPLRVPVSALLVFVPVLMTSTLNIGFRYALPALPMLGVIAAVGATAVWHADWRHTRRIIAAATVWLIVHPLSYFPNFLSYISEYGPGRDRNYTVLVDSSMDWGQGLVQLREFMREYDVPRVYLSYYGTAWPGAYGIEYVPLSSVFNLPDPGPSDQPPPSLVVISATNLAGAGYLIGSDPFRQFRETPPLHIIGNTMHVFAVPDGTPAASVTPGT